MHNATFTAKTSVTATRGFSATAFLGWIVERAQVANQRRALSALDADALTDIGISYSDAAHEAAKPFWA